MGLFGDRHEGALPTDLSQMSCVDGLSNLPFATAAHAHAPVLALSGNRCATCACRFCILVPYYALSIRAALQASTESGFGKDRGTDCLMLYLVRAEHEQAYNTVYNDDDGSEEHKGKLSHEVVSGLALVADFLLPITGCPLLC